MATMAQRIEELRSGRGLSRPALAAALGLPRMSVEKFETGRQTPTQAQQEKLAAYFGVSAAYLRGEAGDPAQAQDWMDGAFLDEPAPAPRPAPSSRRTAEAAPGGGQTTVFDALAGGKKFQETLRAAVLEVLKSPEGQELLSRAVRQELMKRR